jgi:predicted lipoprotein
VKETRPLTKPKLWLSFGWCVIASVIASLGSCRKSSPDEIVYTGARTQPTGGPSGGTSAVSTGGASSTSGGTASGARGGSGGTSGEAPTGGRDSNGGGAGVDTTDAGAGGEAGTTDPGPACDLVAVATGSFSKRGLLEATASCARREYCLFEIQAKALRDRTATAASEPSEEASAAARDAWLTAIASWQEAEVFQFGPASAELNPGGRGLRDLVYSWPLSARCKVDEQTVSGFYERDAFLGSASESPSSGRTLHALEYLLFYSGTTNGCSAYSTINSTGSWNRLSADDVRRRKLDYAARTAEDVLRRAQALVSAWSPDDGAFGSKLVEPGAVYASEQAALNAVGGSLFYIDKQVKDWKLATPLGLDPACPAASCPDLVEAVYARTSVDHIAKNLRGFRKLFQGCGDGSAGFGFDDWLVAVGAAELSARMLAALDGVEVAVAALDQPLEALVVSDPGRVRAVYDALKALTDPLKTEFVATLNLERPAGTIGDND